MKRIALVIVASALAMLGLSSCQSTESQGHSGHSHSGSCSH